MTFPHIEIFGEKQKPPLLFLHGFMGSGKDWISIIDHFKKEYFCITIDLPGHGQSVGEKFESQYSFPAFGKLLTDYFQEAGWTKISMIGYSLGGRLALYLALNFPDYFKTVILESASPGLKFPEERERRIQNDAALVLKINSMDFQEFLENWYHQPIFGKISEQLRFPEMITRRLKNSPAELEKSLKYMGTGAQPAQWKLLNKNKLPLFLLTGEFDIKFQRIAREMQKINPEIQQIEIKNAAHNCHFENEAEFIEIVRKCLMGMKEKE